MNAPRRQTGTRRRVVWIAVLGLTLLLAGAWLRYLLPRHALAELGRLTGTHIRAGGATLTWGGIAHLRHVVVASRHPLGYEDTLATAGDIRVCFAWADLWRRRPRVQSVQLDDVVLSLLRDPETGRWNTQGLTWPQGKTHGAAPPRVTLTRGRLRYLRVTDGQCHEVLKIPLAARLDPAPEGAGGALNVTLNLGSEGTLSGQWSPAGLSLRGSLTGTHSTAPWSLPQVSLTAAGRGPDRGRVRLRVHDAEIRPRAESPCLGAYSRILGELSPITGRLDAFVERYRPTGRYDVEVTVPLDPNAPWGSECRATVTCRDLAFEDCRFPYRVEHLQGDIHLSRDGLHASDLRGTHGAETSIAVAFHSGPFAEPWHYRLDLTAENVPLAPDLYRALAPRYRAVWDRLRPVGTIAATYALRRDPSGVKTRSLRIRPRGIRAAYRAFPYPLENLTGTLRVSEGQTHLEGLVASRGASRITLNGTLSVPRTGAAVPDIRIEAQGIPLDETLARALPESQRDAFRRLGLSGSTDAWIDIATPSADTPPYRARLHARHVHLDVPRWNQDVNEAEADATLTPDRLLLHRLTGRCGTSTVVVRGDIDLGDPNGVASRLTIAAEAFDLADLADGLAPAPAARMRALGLAGTVRLNAQVITTPEATAPKVTATLRARSVRARPPVWPYPWHDIRGTVRLAGSDLTLEALSARPDDTEAHDATRLEIAGSLNLETDRVDLTLAARDLPLNPDFVAALPQSWRQALSPLGPRGRLDLQGGELHQAPRSSGLPSRLRGRLILTDCDLSLFGAPADVNALADVNVATPRGGPVESGRVAVTLRQIRVRGKRAHDVRADLVYDPALRRWAAETVVGDLYGGRLLGTFALEGVPDAPPRVWTQLGFHDVDLYRFLSDTDPNRLATWTPSHGRLAGSLSLGSQPLDRITWLGRCRLRIDRMEVGGRSPFAQIADSVRGYARDDIRFDRLYVDGSIQNARITFTGFDIAGRSLALCGTGTLDLAENRVRLDLTTRGPRGPTADPTILQSLSEGLGGAVLRVNVTGDPVHPTVETRPLPVIEDTLRILSSRRPAP